MPSLKNRIALVYLVTTGILVGLVYIVIYISTREILYNHYDQSLREEFQEVGSSMSIQDGTVYVLAQPEWTEQEHGELTASPVFLQAMDPGGGVIRTSPNLRDSRLTFRPNQNDTLVTTVDLGNAEIRQIQGPIYNRAGTCEGYLLVGMGIAEGALLLTYLKWIMLLSFPLLIAVIVGISRVFGQSIVRPIASLMATADHISKENLDERVPLPKRHDELDRLSRTVNSLLDRLQEVILREQTFAADAAHELRTPLAVLKGTLEVLVRQPREPQQYEEKLRYCVAEIDRLSSLVDQLLLVAKYESRSAVLQPVEIDLAQRTAAALERLEPLARAKRISFQLSFSDTALIHTDPLLLDAVVGNVLSNALKYSPEASPVDVRVCESESAVELSVVDRGPGITPEQIDKVFNRFYRAETTAGDHTKGFGLGLALVKRLSDLLNIEISLQSNPGQGTTFRLRIPRQLGHLS